MYIPVAVYTHDFVDADGESGETRPNFEFVNIMRKHAQHPSRFPRNTDYRQKRQQHASSLRRSEYLGGELVGHIGPKF